MTAHSQIKATEAIVSSDDWTEIRRNTIGAHEIPALLAPETDVAGEDHEEFETADATPISAYTSPLALWEMKTGRFKPTGNARKGLWARIKYGFIQSACDDLGLETRRPAGVFIHPEQPHMSSRVDMEVSEDGGTTWLPAISFNVATKLSDTWQTAVGEWAAPEHVQLQCQHHMAVTGAERIYVFALIGGVTTKVFTEDRDPEMIEIIEEAVEGFWTCIDEDRKPEADPNRDLDVINRLYSRLAPDAPVVDMRGNAELSKLIERKDSLSKQQNELKKEIQELNAEIAQMVGPVASAIVSDTQQIRWIHVKERHQPAATKPGYSYLRTSKITDKSAGATLQDLVAADTQD